MLHIVMGIPNTVFLQQFKITAGMPALEINERLPIRVLAMHFLVFHFLFFLQTFDSLHETVGVLRVVDWQELSSSFPPLLVNVFYPQCSHRFSNDAYRKRCNFFNSCEQQQPNYNVTT